MARYTRLVQTTIVVLCTLSCIPHVKIIVPHLCFGYYVELEFLVDERGAGFGEVALVGDETAAAEAARTAQLVHPLGPLGVEVTVRLLILGLEHTYDFL